MVVVDVAVVNIGVVIYIFFLVVSIAVYDVDVGGVVFNIFGVVVVFIVFC